ncbi:MAG: hypothetical protein IKX71_01565 [Bacteroidales bacterium]|nr:hypothetical protein [Bacteroidales bacterium]
MCFCRKTKLRRMEVVDVNAHLHTPYSFSAFDSIPQAAEMAASQGVKVVGINDFYSMDGYADWDRETRARKLYPLFNIEFISLNSEDQAAGVRVNDPNNPGRTYISGKGLAFPVKLSGEPAAQLAAVKKESNLQVAAMCEKVAKLFADAGVEFGWDEASIREKLTKGSLRERHLAKAIRLAVEGRWPVGAGHDVSSEDDHDVSSEDDHDGKGNVIPDLIGDLYAKILGQPLKSDITNNAAVENEIRSRLLKAGGAAFVPETPEAFLPMATVREIILAAGGIPTYPFLADDAKGGFTDFEGDLAKAAATLKARGFYSTEFITTRNSVEVLERYAQYLWDQGFVVTFGSEHNTPAMEPIKLACRGGVDLTDNLKRLNYWGACIVAAHQKLVADGFQGYLDAQGRPDLKYRDKFILMGDKIIKEAIK